MEAHYIPLQLNALATEFLQCLFAMQLHCNVCNGLKEKLGAKAGKPRREHGRPWNVPYLA